MEWDPSLQAPELPGTVRFYQELLQSLSNLHLPCFSNVSPSLVQVFLQKWSHRVPQDQQLQISGWMAAVLCFQDFCFPSVVNPTLGWCGLAKCSDLPWLTRLTSSWAVKHPGIISLWSWSWSAGSGLQPWQLSRLGEAAGEAFRLQKVQNCSAKFVISAGNVWSVYP